jgi:mannosyl-oligosaccharide alpha-1,2-mannosidase
MFALGASILPPSVLPPEEKELHEWAAQGLTYTCALMYADQLSGLGPEEISMPPHHGRRWIREINKWRRRGKVGPAPGTAEPPAESEVARRDYWNTWGYDTHLLRPEVMSFLELKVIEN